jgi:transposase
MGIEVRIPMPRPKGNADLLENRRKRALALLDAGNSLHEVGRRIGCNPSSVMRWRDARRWDEAGVLQVRFPPGRPTKLIVSERKQLVRLLLKGATAQGYGTNLWTTARIAELIEREFSVRYHPDHVGRLMHGLGWTAQKPERRALMRDEGKIEQWKQEDWPRIKKSPLGWVPISSLPMNRTSC